MNNRLIQIISLLKENLGLFLSISFGLFLFVLFFQPFPLDHFDFNNRLLFVAGLGGIVFLFMVLIRIIFSLFSQKYIHLGEEPVFPFYLSGFIILALSSVAFAFYVHYVGKVEITFFVMSRVVLICLAPPIILGIYDMVKDLKLANETLVKEKEITHKQIEKYEDDYLNKTIEFVSEKSSENLTLLVSDVAIIKSADNYVEIVFKEENHFKKKLIRNTLKNIEQQIKPFPDFIRCHRICIVNSHYIEKLHRNYNGHWLTIKGYDEQIPISRQYLLKFKESN
jgi:hypothetical protein